MAKVLRLDVDMQNIQLMKDKKLFLQSFYDVFVNSKQGLTFFHRELNAVLEDKKVKAEDRHDLGSNLQNSCNLKKSVLLHDYNKRVKKILGLEGGAFNDSSRLIYIVVVYGGKCAGLSLQKVRVIFGGAIA